MKVKEACEIAEDCGLETIGDNAFVGCYGLRSIVLPNSVKNINSGAFQNCEAIEEMVLGLSVEHIGAGAFVN